MERLCKDEIVMIESICSRNRDKLRKIKESPKCTGDKIRDIIKEGITNNAVYARKMLEIA